MEILIEIFKQVKDFRRGQGKRHPLWFILIIILLGIMNGHTHYRAIGNFAQLNRETLTKTFKIASGQVPSYSTIRRIMMSLDCAALIEIFNQWAKELPPEGAQDDELALDGKSLCSTVEHYRQRRQNFVSIVSVFGRKNKLVLSLDKLENKKTSEIHCVQGMVRNLAVTGRTLTLDALHCQKETIAAIVESENDYIITVKKNQKTLYNTLEAIGDISTPTSEDVTSDVSHGRQVERKVSVFPFPKELKSTWKKARCFVKIERSGYRGTKPYYQRSYYLSSCQEEAMVFGEKIRGHWEIENQLHWPKDVLLKEDLSPIHDFVAATNFAILTTIAMNLFRFLGFLSINQGQMWWTYRWSRLISLF